MALGEVRVREASASNRRDSGARYRRPGRADHFSRPWGRSSGSSVAQPGRAHRSQRNTARAEFESAYSSPGLGIVTHEGVSPRDASEGQGYRFSEIQSFGSREEESAGGRCFLHG